MPDLRAHLEQLAVLMPEAFGLEGPVDDFGFYAIRHITDGEAAGSWLVVEPQTFKRARLGISAAISDRFDIAIAVGYADVWDYPSRAAALQQLQAWDGVGEPEGWTRHAATGRRRQADGSIRIRTTDIDPRLVAQLRQQVADGAGHDCEEWFGEHGRCMLCDGVQAKHTVDREPLIVLTDFVGRGMKAQTAVRDLTREQIIDEVSNAPVHTPGHCGCGAFHE